MASCTYNPGIDSSNPYAVLTVTEKEQSIANNTTTVAYSLVLYRPSAISSSASKSYSVVINGTTVASGSTTIGGSGSKTIASGTTTISHNSDGSKSISFSFSLAFAITWSGVYIGTGSANGTMALTTIPRASSISVEAFTLGSAGTIAISRASSSFTHTLRYAWGDTSGTIVEKTSSTSVSWTPPLSFANYIPNNTTGHGTLYCDTYNGSTLIGSSYVIFAADVPSSVVPTVSLSVSDAMGYLSTYGGYVQSKSKFKIAITASGSYGSTIKSYSTTADGSTYTDSSITTDVIKNSGTLTIKVTVKDSRGRSASASKEVTVLAYAVPKISAMSVARCNSDGTANASGAYLKVTFSATITSLNSKNTATYKVQYKKKSASSYTTATVSSHTGNYSVSGGTYVFSADTGSSYDVTLLAVDAFAEIPKSATAGTISVFRSIFAKGLGVAFGKIAEIKNAFEVNWDAYFYKKLYLQDDGGNNVDLLQKIQSHDNSITELNSNLNNLPSKIEVGQIRAFYKSNTLLQATATLSQSFSISSAIAIANPLVASQTPYSQVTGVTCEMISSNSINIYVHGSGFVSGHVLSVAFLVAES